MAKNSKISWTNHTFNPWWGCQKVSPGCQNCYAEAFATGRMGFDIWGPPSTTGRRIFDLKHFDEPIAWNSACVKSNIRERVFCGSMCDIFEDHPQVANERDVLWTTIEFTSSLDWLLLTKRPENIERLLPAWWFPGERSVTNVSFGITAENQDCLDAKWPVLEATTRYLADKLFLSCEPLLGPINIEQTLDWQDSPSKWGRGVDWVIVGGESGPNARPMNLDWARSIRDQCIEFEIPFFFKQVGGRGKDHGGNVLDGHVWQQTPWRIASPENVPFQLELF